MARKLGRAPGVGKIADPEVEVRNINLGTNWSTGTV